MMHRIPFALVIFLSACGLHQILGDTPAGKPKIEPKADEMLKKACACLADLKQFGVKVEEIFDEMSEYCLSRRRTLGLAEKSEPRP